LIVGQRVSTCASDSGELEADLASIPASLGPPTAALADCGYVDKEVFERLGRERPGLDLYVSVHREDAHAERRYDWRPLDKIKAPKTIIDPVLVAMAEKLQTPEGKATYRRRACTVEAVFGIIKAALGFRQFYAAWPGESERRREPRVPGLQLQTAAHPAAGGGRGLKRAEWGKMSGTRAPSVTLTALFG